MATPRGKKTLRTNTRIRLITSNPPGRYRTKRVAPRLRIPNAAYCNDASEYVAAFTSLNNLLPSEFTVNGKVARL